MIYTPDMNDGHTVFVFGSNLAGIHGAGAAKEAYEHWGAIWGWGEGRQGQSYAVPTKNAEIRTRPFRQVETAVGNFLRYAERNPAIRFLVTAVGCGLAGFSPKTMGPLFRHSSDNCVLPPGWRMGQYDTLADHTLAHMDEIQKEIDDTCA